MSAVSAVNEPSPWLAAPSRLLKRARLLPPGPPPKPVVFTAPLVLFVGAVSAAALALALATVRFDAPLPPLMFGGVAVAALAGYSVSDLSGVDTGWSASGLLHLGLTLALGPIGAAVSAVADALGSGIRYQSGWFRSAFNAANNFLSDLAALMAFRAVIDGAPASSGRAALAGATAGLGQFVVNYLVLAGVLRVSGVTVKIGPYLRQATRVLPYNIGYGWAAFGFTVLYQHSGLVGITAAIAPVVLLQGFLVFLARRMHTHAQQTTAHAAERERLLQRVIDTSDRERRRIAHDLHDGVVQRLAALSFRLASAERTVDEGHSERLRSSLRSASDDIRQSIRELRTLIIDIAPANIDRARLANAIEDLVSRLQPMDIAVTTDIMADPPLEPESCQLIYRVAQEAVRNVAAHAQAGNVTASLRRHGDRIVFRLIDDGRGFSADDLARRRSEGHAGTRLLEEMVRDEGAEVTIDSTPGVGTSLTLAVPCRG